jgi:plasmid stability protein
MPVNLSIKNVPDSLAERLRRRARRNRRSLQGELLTILEEATRPPAALSVDSAERRLRRLALNTPDEARVWIRELRDAR